MMPTHKYQGLVPRSITPDQGKYRLILPSEVAKKLGTKVKMAYSYNEDTGKMGIILEPMNWKDRGKTAAHKEHDSEEDDQGDEGALAVVRV